ncbi:MAG: superinfection immunity protein [Candidatus Nanopelagicales bacterium]
MTEPLRMPSPDQPVVYAQAVRPFQASTTVKVISVIAAILTGGYLLPWAIAAVRDLRTHVGVGLVNLLLGWTIVFWIVALVMSLRRKRPDEA